MKVQLLKKFGSVYKNLNDQAWSGRPKTIDFEAMFKAINLVSSTMRVSGELSISLSSVVCHLHNRDESIHSCEIVSHVNRVLQNL